MHTTTVLLSILTFTTTALSLPSIVPRASAQLPQSGLPAPSGDVKYIALGVGTQNYTCTGSGAVPVAAGAVADLYDATAVLSSKPAMRWPVLAQQAMTCVADRMDSGLGLRKIGQHYFNAAGQPSFDLWGLSNSFLLAKKLNNVAAPSNACQGRNGAGAVDWLYLVDNGLGGSRNVDQVYRVHTAGGKAPATCPDSNWIIVDYAAEYWFYD